MHSRIFEINAEPIENDEWVSECEIADENYRIEGVDYYDTIKDADERVEHIENFFGEYFPGKSFEIVKNEPGQTAIVKFVGDIHELDEQWREQIRSAANSLTVDAMSGTGVFRVRMACEEPFDLSTKFYMNGWTGCTTSACDFFDYLRYLSRENEGEPFLLYVGQVFDYHF